MDNVEAALASDFAIGKSGLHCCWRLGRQVSHLGRQNARFVGSALRSLGILIVALLVSTPAFAAAVGMITKVENQAQVGGGAAAVGSLVQMGDQLHTGPKSRIEVTFQDKTTITLGENATLVVDRYIYNPERSTGELLVSSGVGAFRMATGRLNEMSNKKITASTPFGALAVRGTEFWWGKINHQYGTLLMSNSRLVVSHETDRCPPEEETEGSLPVRRDAHPIGTGDRHPAIDPMPARRGY